MELPAGWETAPLVVRLGRYYFDDTPLIGKIVDFNMWDRSTPPCLVSLEKLMFVTPRRYYLGC